MSLNPKWKFSKVETKILRYANVELTSWSPQCSADLGPEVHSSQPSLRPRHNIQWLKTRTRSIRAKILLIVSSSKGSWRVWRYIWNTETSNIPLFRARQGSGPPWWQRGSPWTRTRTRRRCVLVSGAGPRCAPSPPPHLAPTLVTVTSVTNRF